MYRYMSVDDVAVWVVYAESIEDFLGDLLVIAQAEIVAFLFVPSLTFVDELTFEGGHFRLVE